MRLVDVKRLNIKGAEFVVLSACQMQSSPAIQIVEDKLGVAVTSTAVCTTHQMLDKLGLEPIAQGAGALLSGHYARVA